MRVFGDAKGRELETAPGEAPTYLPYKQTSDVGPRELYSLVDVGGKDKSVTASQLLSPEISAYPQRMHADWLTQMGKITCEVKPEANQQ